MTNGLAGKYFSVYSARADLEGLRPPGSARCERPAMTFLIPTLGPSDWRSLLADPQGHWRSGYSAKTLAHCWEAAEGFPRSVVTVLEQSAQPALQDIEMLLALPEHSVPLPGIGRPS